MTFYKDKTVLLTGHTGFKGAWLVSWLKALGAKVIGFSLPPEAGTQNLFEAAHVERDMISVFGDLRDYNSLVDVFKAHSPEIVFHLAAQSLVRRSYHEPIATYATNVMGTVHVLEAARQTPSVRSVVIITSDKCYENREWIWGYRENDPMGGHDPYSSSKGCAEIVTNAYRSSFFNKDRRVAIASARAGNVIGGGDWAEDRLIPDVIRAIAADEPIVLRNPNAIRPWQHVFEPLRGYLMLGERLYQQGDAFAEGWNFGPSDEDAIPVNRLVKGIIQHWGLDELMVEELNDGLHEAQYLKLDCSKARMKLGWRPLIANDEALQLTVEWYKAYHDDPSSASQLTAQQIQRYMERLS